MHHNPNNRRCDAHCHLGSKLTFEGRTILNGTSPEDWSKVIDFAANRPTILPAIGLHPWQVRDAPPDWQEQFLAGLDAGACAVGEIGLDRHFAKDSFDAQRDAFTWQLERAAERNLPVSIHCLKATDSLLHLLRETDSPTRGIHLHAYSGSAEEAAQFVELGAYFSFHADQLSPPARKAPEALQCIPLDRLLIESDAPDTLKPNMNQRDYLETAYQRAAKICDIPLLEVTERVMANFHRYFLDD